MNDDVGNQLLQIKFDPLPGTDGTADSTLALPARFYVWGSPRLSLTDLWFGYWEPNVNVRYPVESPHNWIEFTRYEPEMGGIVSGTFSFDVLSEAGDTVQIRDGRFDLLLGDR